MVVGYVTDNEGDYYEIMDTETGKIYITYGIIFLKCMYYNARLDQDEILLTYINKILDRKYNNSTLTNYLSKKINTPNF